MGHEEIVNNPVLHGNKVFAQAAETSVGRIITTEAQRYLTDAIEHQVHEQDSGQEQEQLLFELEIFSQLAKWFRAPLSMPKRRRIQEDGVVDEVEDGQGESVEKVWEVSRLTGAKRNV